MPIIMTASQGGPTIDDGTFPATLLGISLEAPTERSPNQREWLKWVFAVDDGSPEGIELMAPSAYKLTPKTKTRAWVEAVLGRKLEPDEQVTMDTLAPRDCFVTIAHNDQGFAKIENVLPVPKKSPGKAGKAAITPPPPRTSAGSANEDEEGVSI